MDNLLKFMGEHPVFSFLIACVICTCIVGIFKMIAYAFQGAPKVCPKCGYHWDADEDDED